MARLLLNIRNIHPEPFGGRRARRRGWEVVAGANIYEIINLVILRRRPTVSGLHVQSSTEQAPSSAITRRCRVTHQYTPEDARRGIELAIFVSLTVPIPAIVRQS